MQLIVGATGFLGRYLQATLLRQGLPVRCLLRRASDSWRLAAPSRPVAVGDVLVPDSLEPALEGIEVLYYLVHAMRDTSTRGRGGEQALVDRERQGIENVVAAARRRQVRRIVYVSGLASQPEATPHLRGRFEVERVIRQSGLPYTILRAGPIIGWESLPFQVVYQAVRLLPVIGRLRWMETRCQPIFVGDILHYLVACQDVAEAGYRTFEVGGPDVLTYEEMLGRLDRILGTVTLQLPAPIRGMWITSRFVHWATDTSLEMSETLVRSLFSEMVCRERAIAGLLPRKLAGFEEACLKALIARGPGRVDPLGKSRSAGHSSDGELLMTR
jgi:uncharacterized protein YbjT (DUF2867 family)